MMHRGFPTIQFRTLVRPTVIGLSLLIGCGSDDTTGPDPSFYHTIGGTVEGLIGNGLVLQNSSSNNLSVSPGATTFTFSEVVSPGSGYTVAVLTQPSNPAQTCVVSNGTGTATANVTSVLVTCTTP